MAPRLTTYVALLRGVNVGGHRIVKMDRLRSLVAELGFDNVRTYIQSGNVLFDTKPTARDLLQRKITKHLERALGFDVVTFVRSVAEVEELVAREPFAGVAVGPDTRLLVAFLSRPLPDDLAVPFASEKSDVELVGHLHATALLVLRQRPGRTVDPVPFLERIAPGSTPMTGRFFHVAKQLVEAARAAPTGQRPGRER